MRVCPSCGEENNATAKFCQECATPLADAPGSRDVRKTVTVLFCDVTGSTSIGERLDPETLRQVMSAYFDRMKVEIERHGGTVEKFIGDAVMAVFGVPAVHDDDALRAVRAAVAMREALTELNRGFEHDHGVKIQVRTGIHTGEVVAGEGEDRQRLVTGDTVNVAARFEQSAAPGEILFGRDTYRLVRDAVEVERIEPLELKGKTLPVEAFRLVSLQASAPGIARRSDTAFVGRDREREMIADGWTRCTGEHTSYLFTLLGVAGVGKSRLVAEVLSALEPAPLVLSGRCLPYGDGITFWPILEIVRGAADLGDADSAKVVRSKVAGLVRDEDDGARIAERLLGLMGLGPSTGVIEETQWAVRRMFEAIARHHPAVVVIDDLHWAEPALLDLIEHVVDWIRDAPLLLLGLARPEFLEDRPTWGGGKFNAASILLEPLNAVDTSVLIERLLGSVELPPDVERRVAEAADGNPLFVEELLAAMIDDGTLEATAEGGWRATSSLDDVELPPSVQVLLASRLERLHPSELALLEGGAVVGQVFYRDAVAALAPEALRPDVGTYLHALVRKDLVRPERGGFPGDEAYRFRHILLRDAAYRAMPKETRAELHERFAEWLERAAGDRIAEYEEIVGYHLEQAFRFRASLGRTSEESQGLADRAAARLAASGRRAIGRGDRIAATRLLRRAADLPATNEREQLEVLFDLAMVLDEVGKFEEAIRVARQASDLATQGGAAGPIAFAEMLVGWVGSPNEPDEGAVVEAARTLDVEDRHLRAAQAWAWVGWIEWEHWRASAAFDAWANAIERAADEPILHAMKLELRWAQGISLYFGTTPIAKAIETMEQELLPAVDGSLIATTGIRALIAEMHVMQGGANDVLGPIAEWHEALLMHGLKMDAANFCPQALADVHMLQGDPKSALEALVQGQQETIALLGERNALLDGMLADVSYQRGEYDEAGDYAEMSRGALQSGNVSVEYLWRSVASQVEARRGNSDAAVRLLEEADLLLEGTDFSCQRADHLMRASETLELIGDVPSSTARVEEALQIYREKGVPAWIARAEERLSHLTGAAPRPA